jgi:sorting nexin-8
MAIPQWWDKEAQVSVRLVPQKEGKWPGLKWTVYEVGVKKGLGGGQDASVHRRYSEFVWLWECLVKRVSPALPARQQSCP